MKKWVFFAFGCFFSFTTFAQVNIGLQVSPSLSFNRVDESSDTADLSAKGVGGKLQAGIFSDFLITKSYYFSTGIFFVPKRIALQDTRNPSVEEVYHLQYLQVPAMLKVYTEEISLDTRIYIQSGLNGEIKINEKGVSPESTYLGNFRTFDASWIIGAGLEYRIGYSTTLFGGFSYRRGLINVVTQPLQPFDGDLSLKNDFVSLDVGIKF
jgi:hypothetical protein